MAKKQRKESRVAPTASAPAAPAAKERFPAWLVWPVVLGWAGFVLKSYFSRFPLNLDPLAMMLAPGQYTESLFSVLPGHLLSLLAAAAFFFACFSLGRAALRAAGFAFAGAFEELSLSCGAGFGLLAAYVFVLASLKLLYLWPVAAFLLAAAGLGAWQLRSAPLAAAEGGGPGAFGPFDLAALAALLLALLLNLAGALAPEIFYDALVYHLAVPNYFVIHHGFAPMAYNFYSDLPFTHGMLYAAALLLKGPGLAKLINYGAGLLTVLAVLSFGARHFTLRAGLWAALIFYTVAHTMFSAWSTGTEALLTLFATLALYAALNRRDGGARWLWLAAAFCGLGMGVKYTGLFPTLGVMLVCAWQDRARPSAALKNLAVFTLIASVFTGPWLVKNWLYTGNPVFPFALKLFGAGATADPQKLTEFAGQAAQMGPLTPKSWLLTQWKVTMGQVPNSEYFTPLFLALLPTAFLLAAPAGPALAGLWAFFLVSWLGWCATSTMVRFLMPAYPTAGLVLAAYLFSPGHRALKAALKAAALAACLAGLYVAALIFYSQGRWRPVAGAVPAEEYLAHTQPTYPYSCYAAIKFINERTPPDSKTLMIGDEKSFYFKKDFVVSSVYDRTAIVEYAAASKDGDDLYARLKADGVTHLLLNTADAVRLAREYRMFYWDARARKVFDEFWARHVRSVFAFDEAQGGRVFNRVEVYELADRLPPGVPPAFNAVEEIVMRGAQNR